MVIQSVKAAILIRASRPTPVRSSRENGEKQLIPLRHFYTYESEYARLLAASKNGIFIGQGASVTSQRDGLKVSNLCFCRPRRPSFLHLIVSPFHLVLVIHPPSVLSSILLARRHPSSNGRT